MMNKPVYALSGDPTTNGHLDVIERVAKQEGGLVVALGNNADKKYMFSMPERVYLTQKAISSQIEKNLQANIEVVGFTGLLTDFIYRNSLSKIYRGVRNKTDEEFELFLHKINSTQEADTVTQTLQSTEKLSHISSSAVKALLKDQGQIDTYVPLHIKQALEARMLEQYPVSLTGSIGSGKSYIANKLTKLGEESGIKIHNIDMDLIGHKILDEYSDQCYIDTRAKLIKTFGDITDENGNIVRSKLGSIALSSEENVEKLNSIMAKPLKFAIRDAIKGKKGVILYNGALIPEWDFEVHSNNNVILLDVEKEKQAERVMSRSNSSREDTERKIARQANTVQKIQMLEENKEQYNHGTTIYLDNTEATEEDIKKLFEQMLETIDIYGDLRIGRALKTLGLDVSAKEFIGQFKNKDMYDNDARSHHNWHHIIDCINKLGRIKHLIKDEKKYHLMVLAFVGHDGIYASNSKTPKAREIESGIFMMGVLKKYGLGDEEIHEIYEFILDTRHREVPSSELGKLFADIDMSTLAGTPDQYLTYIKAIRREYSQYTDKQFTEGRLAILQKFLSKNIFYSKYFRTFEKTARSNIEKEIIDLKKKSF